MKRICSIFLSLLAIVAFAQKTDAARTVIAREMFRGTTPLTSTNTGAFSGVYGQIGRWRVGPKLTTDTDLGTHGDVPAHRVSLFSSVSFTASTKTISDSGNHFLANGFAVGESITVSGSVSNNGNFTVVSVTNGTIVVAEPVVDEAVGSRTISIWSRAGAYFNLVDGGDGSQFCFECWYLTGEVNPAGFQSLFQAGINFGSPAPWYNAEINIFRKSDGSYLFRHPTETDATILESAIPRHTIVRLYLYEIYLGSFRWTYRMGYQLPGGAETDVWNRVNQLVTNVTHYDVIGFATDQSNVPCGFALGGVSLTQITSPTDFGPDTGITPPVNAWGDWYVTNTGVAGDGSITSPMTDAQFAAAMAGHGIAGNTGTGNAYGAHVHFLAGAHQVPTAIMTVRQRGMWMDGGGVATLRYAKTITGTWTQPDAGGAPNVWAINDSEITPVTLAVPILFERPIGCTTTMGNGLTPAAGANFAAVKSTLQSTAGSFWSDGTTMYVHPFGDTNPNIDGKTYERTASSPTECGVQIGGQDQRFSGFGVFGTAYYDKTSVQNVSGLAVSDDGGTSRSGGLVDAIQATYWGKHGGNFTTGTTSTLTISNSTFEMGWPYGGGAQTCLVNYATSGTQAVNIINVNARMSHNAWAVGATSAGLAQANTGAPVWISHDAGGLTNEFSSITFTNCHFDGGTISPTIGVDQAVIFNGCDKFSLSGFGITATVSGTPSGSSSLHPWLNY